jgi:hypothetical protein
MGMVEGFDLSLAKGDIHRMPESARARMLRLNPTFAPSIRAFLPYGLQHIHM